MVLCSSIPYLQPNTWFIYLLHLYQRRPSFPAWCDARGSLLLGTMLDLRISNGRGLLRGPSRRDRLLFHFTHRSRLPFNLSFRKPSCLTRRDGLLFRQLQLKDARLFLFREARNTIPNAICSPTTNAFLTTVDLTFLKVLLAGFQSSTLKKSDARFSRRRNLLTVQHPHLEATLLGRNFANKNLSNSIFPASKPRTTQRLMPLSGRGSQQKHLLWAQRRSSHDCLPSLQGKTALHCENSRLDCILLCICRIDGSYLAAGVIGSESGCHCR